MLKDALRSCFGNMLSLCVLISISIFKAINGRSYGNLESLDMCHGDAVAWHVMSMGGKEGLHGVKFNGNNILTGGVNRDAYVVVPGTTFTGLMHAGNAGRLSGTKLANLL